MLRIANGFIVENPKTLEEAFDLLKAYGDGVAKLAEQRHFTEHKAWATCTGSPD